MQVDLSLEIQLTRADLSKRVARLSRADVIGLGCRDNWANVISRYIISDMFLCTNADALDKCDKDCLIGKMTKGLNNCC